MSSSLSFATGNDLKKILKRSLKEYGPNEIPVIETPIWKMILSQFVGVSDEKKMCGLVCRGSVPTNYTYFSRSYKNKTAALFFKTI